MSRLRGGLIALVAAVVVVTGCTSTGGRSGSAGATAGTAPAPAGPSCLPPPASAGSSSAPTPTPTPTGSSPATTATAAGERLPDLTLPCFVGGQPVRLAHLGTPAVINLWASWCGPCRGELPQLQRYADRAAGRVQVVGVITGDPDRRAPQSLVDDLGLRFPMLYDGQARLQTRLGPPVVMPTTLLVDAGGRVVYRYNARPLDEAALADLVQRYLGVAA